MATDMRKFLNGLFNGPTQKKKERNMQSAHWIEVLTGCQLTRIPRLTTGGAEYGPLLAGIAFISPSTAEVLLRDHNHNNRPKGWRHIKVMAAAMTRGWWMLTGEPIIISKEREVVNGQHRLEAILLAGLPVVVLVVCDVDSSAFEYMDQGRRRGMSDVLGIDGFEDNKILSSAIPILQNFLSRGVLSKSGRQPAENVITTQRKLLCEHEGLVQSAEFVRQYGNKIRIIQSKGLAAALHYVFTAADADTAQEFMGNLLQWSIPAGDKWRPLSLLFARLVKSLEQTNKMSADAIAHAIVKTWNAVRNGNQAVRLITHEYEEFPRVSGITYENDLPILK